MSKGPSHSRAKLLLLSSYTRLSPTASDIASFRDVRLRHKLERLRQSNSTTPLSVSVFMFWTLGLRGSTTQHKGVILMLHFSSTSPDEFQLRVAPEYLSHANKVLCEDGKSDAKSKHPRVFIPLPILDCDVARVPLWKKKVGNMIPCHLVSITHPLAGSGFYDMQRRETTNNVLLKPMQQGQAYCKKINEIFYDSDEKRWAI
ncbi:hypothetical protein V8B97DRAFT_907785 [Scleroderma yunnanense]